MIVPPLPPGTCESVSICWKGAVPLVTSTSGHKICMRLCGDTIPTWFGSISFDSRRVILQISSFPSKSSSESIEVDDVAHVACTHLHVAILMKNGKLAVRRIDDFGGNLKILEDVKGSEDTEESRILVSTSREIYVIVFRSLHQKTSKILKILEDSEGILEDSKKEIEFPWPVRIVEAVGGHDFLIYRDSAGNLFSMGTGTRGELGVGLIRRVDEPVHIEQLAGIRVAKVACGGWHTVVLTEDGDAYTWGWNRYGQLGKNKASTEMYPVLIDPAEEFDCSEENIDDVAATEHTSRIFIKIGHAPKEFVLGSDNVPINEFSLN